MDVMKPWLVFLALALALAMVAHSYPLHDVTTPPCRGGAGDICIGDDDELMMDSEISRRTLARSRYISYDALRANSIPCGRRGSSYYNCQRRERANPYNRGCTHITNCARYTD